MGLILLDGMEDFSAWIPGNNPPIVAGRNGNGINVPSSSATVSFNIPTADQTDTLTVGFAIKFAGSLGSSGPFMAFQSDAGVVTHTSLVASTAGGFSLMRASVNILASTASGVIALNGWYYFEFQAKLHDTTGFTSLRINGVTVASATNVDTKNAGTKTVYDQVRFLGPSGSYIVDDVYVRNDATFMSDLAVETLYPNGNGNANAWLGSDGNSTDNYLLVDEAGTPVTTDYVQSSTAAQQDMYTMTDLVRTSGTVLGVTHQAYAAKADSGARQFKIVNRRAADTKSPAIDLTTSFTGHHYSLENDPETAAPFTIANVNALQSGVEVV